ncbi:hypothetical protein F8388_010373 [Cannabis sativa]|uniref:C2H2-type domain-containing protein n=1 Tax=Cannabis sativa TaxID=3483 RepID=A0A7J6HQ61_CANSA|nr:hypothetical protein F8388_010373 [Cannabis sativa]KAF4397416.1 hypothetical protein G4B88_027156 [Cannabis sativa]
MDSFFLSQGDEGSATSRNLVEEIEDAVEVHCSRERSRAASKIIEEYLVPFIEKHQYQIPKSCRLHPDNDLFRDQEQHKIRIDVDEWKCGYCRKSFYEERYIDKHFEQRHNNLLNVSHGKCLADVCGALHCDHHIGLPQKTKCNPAASARNKHLCESIADSCFPVSKGPTSSRVHEFFLRQFCDAHTCTGKSKPFSRGRKVKKNEHTLHRHLRFDNVASSVFLYLHLLVPKRGEIGNTKSETRIAEWKKEKTLLAGTLLHCNKDRTKQLFVFLLQFCFSFFFDKIIPASNLY